NGLYPNEPPLPLWMIKSLQVTKWDLSSRFASSFHPLIVAPSLSLETSRILAISICTSSSMMHGGSEECGRTRSILPSSSISNDMTE
ncbi:hypothetical protein PENTCL1PPCAC_10970, partial [Pristionchus entomophagus]